MFADGVIESSSTTGTGSYTLSGAVFSGLTFAQGFPSGGAVGFFAQTADKSKWEFGYGTLTIGPPRTLTRTTILKSSNAGSAIDWLSTDTKYIFSIASADALSGLLAGNLATSRPWWLRQGGMWWDYTAGLTTSWVRYLYAGGADVRDGFYDAVKGVFFPDNRRPSTAVGAANKTFTADDIGGSFTFSTSGGARTATLPEGSTVKDGYHLELKGLGTSNGIILTPDAGDGIDGGADAATRTVPGGILFTVRWSAADDQWITNYAAPAMAVVSAPLGGGLFSKLKVQVTSDTAITATADSLVLSDGSVNQVVSAFNKSIATGSAGAGGLDTGSIANSTWYAVWAIAKADGTTATMLSASTTAPTMPSGYTFKTRLGMVRTDGSANLIRTLQQGRVARYLVTGSAILPELASGSPGDVDVPFFDTVAVGNFVPSSAMKIAILTSTTSAHCVILAPNNSYAGRFDALRPPPSVTIALGSTAAPHSTSTDLVLESTNIYWAASGTSKLQCMGWEDNL